jgi:tetratricopeptide (TPR) repeat protein
MVEVERLYKKALSLAPADYETNIGYGSFLLSVGRPKDAIDYVKRLVRIEPLSSGPYIWLGWAYEFSGNSDAAVMAMKKGRELTNEPMLFNSSLLALALEENNRALMDEYLALIVNQQLAGNIPDTSDINQVIIALLDTPEEAGAKLRPFLADPTYNYLNVRGAIAIWASYFGEHEIALQALREPIGSEWRNSLLIWRPIHKGMRQLPGFKDFVREIGLVDYWRKSGNWGDFCHPVDDDFVCD